MVATNPIQLLIHGGAGRKRPTTIQQNCLKDALESGFLCLQKGGTALDGVEIMIRLLEGSGLFNAGLGSLKQLDGRPRMDAGLMEGKTLRAGAVANLEGFLHPVSAARIVMEKTMHVMMVGQHAACLARHHKLESVSFDQERGTTEIVKKPKSKSQAETIKLFREMMEFGTVGAVVLDATGTLAAGTSTGGVPMMLPGRVGDSPLIGCGVYADNKTGGVSMTGIGETIIRMAMAKHIAMLIKNGKSTAMAARLALRELVQRVRGEAGVLVLGADGRFAIRHTTPWMSAGHWNGRGKPTVGIRFIP